MQSSQLRLFRDCLNTLLSEQPGLGRPGCVPDTREWVVLKTRVTTARLCCEPHGLAHGLSATAQLPWLATDLCGA